MVYGKMNGKKFLNMIIKTENIKAREKFDSGPAAETFTLSIAGFLKFAGLTGTGFAQPIRKLECDIIKNNGTMIVPTMSMCGMGLKVNRPEYFAVGSPHFNATYP
jgi:hypothetical protein